MIAHVLLPLVLGTLIGLSLGAIGGGGSILTVPILVYVMGQGAHEATATSLAIVGMVALVGAVPHWRAGRAQLATAVPFGLAGLAGAFAGAWANHLLPGRVLLALFGAMMLAVAVRMLWPLVARAGEHRKLTPVARWLRLLVAGLGVGVLTGFFGVGGGFLIVPALVIGAGLSLPRAAAASLFVITLASVSALTRYWGHASVDWPFVARFAAIAAGGAIAGGLAAPRLPQRILQQAFAVALVILGSYVLLKA